MSEEKDWHQLPSQNYNNSLNSFRIEVSGELFQVVDSCIDLPGWLSKYQYNSRITINQIKAIDCGNFSVPQFAVKRLAFLGLGHLKPGSKNY